MLLLCLCFAAICAFFEYKIVSSMPRLQRFLSTYRLAALVFSLVLSVLVGGLFHAGGLTVFFAAMASTVIIQPYYRLSQNLGFLRRLHELRSWYLTKKECYVRRALVLWRMATRVWKVVVLPFHFLGLLLDRLS